MSATRNPSVDDFLGPPEMRKGYERCLKMAAKLRENLGTRWSKLWEAMRVMGPWGGVLCPLGDEGEPHPPSSGGSAPP